MTLKYQLDSLDGIESDDIKGLYAEKDGKFVLNVEGAIGEDEVNGLKSALVKERENVSTYKKLGSPEEIQQRIEAAEAKAKEAGKGTKAAEDQEKIIADLRKEYDQKLEAANGTIQDMRRQTALGAVKAELAKVGVVPEGLDLLGDYAMQRIQFNDDGTPKVLAKDGSGPMIGNGANGGATLGDLAKELAGSIPHLVKDDGKGGSGKQPGSGDGKSGQKTVTRAQFDQMGQAERATFSTEGGKVVEG